LALRSALGADRLQLMQVALRHGLLLTALGLATGVVLAALVSPLLQALPVSVRPPGLLVLGSVAVLIGLMAVAASVIPARRALDADPMTLLRNE
jgi:ABC-type antimicrobial peptide transport system permease subunit